mgnify:FL=1
MSKKYKGLNKLKGRIDKAGRGLSNEYDRETQKAALIARNAAIQRVPVDKGQLKQSISFDRKGKSFYRLSAQMPYAVFQEFGTGYSIQVPSDIESKLRRIGLDHKFGSTMQSNGIKPKLFMTAGYRVAKSYLKVKMQKIVDKKR